MPPVRAAFARLFPAGLQLTEEQHRELCEIEVLLRDELERPMAIKTFNDFLKRHRLVPRQLSVSEHLRKLAKECAQARGLPTWISPAEQARVQLDPSFAVVAARLWAEARHLVEELRGRATPLPEPPARPGEIASQVEALRRWAITARWRLRVPPLRGDVAPEREEPPPAERLRPRWDEERRTFYLGDKEVKRYNRGLATNQIDVLEAFERAGWPPAVDDPFDDPRKLSQTIYDLNKSLKTSSIRFGADGTGERIRWEYAQ